MLIIPKLSDVEEQILQIIYSNDDYTSQWQTFDKVFPHVSHYDDWMGSTSTTKNFGLQGPLNSLINQDFLYQENQFSPYMLTAIGRGYLENNNILIALLDQALLKLDLPENKKNELKTSTMNQFQKSGQEFLIKLLAEGLARVSGL